MIGQLSGKISRRDEKFIILNVSGVGYKVFLSAENLKKAGGIGEEVELWTHLAVKEEALDLYGFLSKSELDFFELLLNVSGVGPKSALAVLSLAPPETLAQAVATSNLSYLTQVSGIGRKMAEKIILELRDKMILLDQGESGQLAEESEALMALKALGYPGRDAREALRQIETEVSDTGEKIKQALKILSKKNSL